MDHGASQANGLGSAEAPEPPSRLGPSDAIPSAAAAVDGWCKDRATKLTHRSNAHILAGKKLDDPAYRLMLGEHRAYLAVRSFIHGSLNRDNKASPMTDRQFDEPDFDTHLRNVLTDYRDDQLDGLDEAVEAIVEHPAVRDALRLKVIGPLEIGEE